MKAFLPLLVILITSACRDEEITRVRVPKEDAPAVAAPAAPDAASALHWDAPKGWKELPGSGMRLATIVPPGGGEVSVTALPGDVGGELANVNRWRGQIGLPAFDEAGLAKSRSKVRSNAGPVTVYDFTSDGVKKSRVVAGTLSAKGRMWFFKLSGDEAAVAAAKPAFMTMLEGVHAAH